MSPLFGFFEGMMSPMHWILLLGVGIMLFGKRLPEMGRYLGKGIIEFKKGLKGIEDEMEGSTPAAPRQEQPAALEPPRPPQRVVTNVPKFEDNPQNITPPQA